LIGVWFVAEAVKRAVDAVKGTIVMMLGESLELRDESDYFEDASAVLDDGESRTGARVEAVAIATADVNPWSGRIDAALKPEITEGTAASKLAGKNRQTEHEVWMHYFVDPGRWWDNRFDKINPRAPAFRHKVTYRGLWVHGRSTPEWVK
jgi:hypothetical protein